MGEVVVELLCLVELEGEGDELNCLIVLLFRI